MDRSMVEAMFGYGIELSGSFANALTLWAYFLAMTVSVVLNIKQVVINRKYSETVCLRKG